jgi:hypothetical protein
VQAYQWSMLGMTIEICGVFFLSVEAIKLPNIMKLRDALLRVLKAIDSPRLIIGDPSPEELKEIEKYNKTAGFGNRWLLYFLAHLFGGLVLLTAVYGCLRLSTAVQR